MDFNTRLEALKTEYSAVVNTENKPVLPGNGIYEKYEHPILTRHHIPVEWKYDLNPDTNPFLMERLGVNAVFNSGAIKVDDKYTLVCRVEGNDRKSFFAVAQSDKPTEGFEFVGEPILLDQTEDPDVNVYDMRLIKHEDGYIYGIFCSERKDPSVPSSDTSSALAQAGMVRTKDLKTWERLPDLKTNSSQQRNVVLHPEFVDGKYAFYTRPQDGFIDTGSGGGISWALADSMENAVIGEESLIDPRIYHTIKEVKNGQGPAPIKTDEGWIHLAHGVRNTAAGLRYVLYLFMTELDQPWKLKYTPGGHFIAPYGDERVGDVSNVVFSNGWITDDDGTVYIYYASSDTRMHVAKTSVARLLDYVKNTPADELYSHKSVAQRIDLIRKNNALA